MIAVVLLICYSVYRASFRTDHSGELMTPGRRANHALFSPGWYNWAILNKYFVDEAYNFWFVKLGKRLSNWLWLTFDVRGIDGIVNGVGAVTAWSGQRVRKVQNGFVRSYALSMVVGIVVILVVVAVRAAGIVH